MSSSTSSRDRVYYLAPRAQKILSAAIDGSDLKTILTNVTKIPDGIDIDVAKGHIYYTRMGEAVKGEGCPYNDGSILRCDLDGGNIATIVPEGGTHTPKQLELDLKNGLIYWCDREGMRVMRCRLDGSHVETLVQSGFGPEDQKDMRRWCVGIAVDHAKGQIYWTQKGTPKGNVGRIFRCGVNIPAGETPDKRSDVEVVFDPLPEPIDLVIDHGRRLLYWTDRGAPPRGDTVNVVKLDDIGKPGLQSRILFGGLHEAIGIALDLNNDKIYFTDLGGVVRSCDLDGKNEKDILTDQGPLTGIVYARV